MQAHLRSRGRWPIALLILVCSQGCSPDAQSYANAPLPADTNVLLVTLDTTRADRIGCYGHSAARTPQLDGLARNGVRFERAYAHVPLTLPTHASLLTGTLPPEHGIHDNGRRALGGELTTLAEVFRGKQHRTAAFVSAIALDASFGLDRGFEVYDDDLAADQPDAGRVLHRAGDQTTTRALAWLDSGAAPFFLWVHYYDPHAEYTPPPAFALPDPYDGEIAFVDAQIGRLLGWLDANQQRDTTLIVAIGDHGESLGEKGEHTHASLIYDGTQHIPFLLNMPSRLPRGLVTADLAGQSDLFPTLMELFDWSVPAAVSGRSLAPLLRGEGMAVGTVWLESEYAALNFGWSSLRGIVHGPWKYVEAPTPELYELLTDPGEKRNLARAQPDTALRLRQRMHDLQAEFGSYGGREADTSASLARDLSGLGYAQGAVGSGDEETSQINPIEHIEVLEQYHAAIGFGNRGDYPRMLAPLESVARAFPQAAGFRTQLGDVYRRVGRLKEARRELQAAIALDGNYDPAHFYLAELERLEAHYPAAIASYRRTLELRPSYAPARERLAGLLAISGERDLALRMFEELLEQDPERGDLWLAVADLYAARGENQKRVAALERAASLNPRDLGTLNLLAWVLATVPEEQLRSGTRALELAQRCVHASADPEPLLTLAAAQAELGQFEEARASLRKAIELASASRAPAFVAELRAHEQTLLNDQPLRQP